MYIVMMTSQRRETLLRRVAGEEFLGNAAAFLKALFYIGTFLFISFNFTYYTRQKTIFFFAVFLIFWKWYLAFIFLM